MIKGFFLGWIVVKDIEKAKKFYTEIVGLTLHSFDPQYKWAELSGPEGMTLGICEEDNEMKAGTNAVMTLTVDDIEATRKDFQQKKVNLLGDVMEIPGHVKLQSFTDTDGNMFQIVQMLG